MFLIVCFYFLKAYFSAVNGCVIFVIVKLSYENIGSSDKIMKPEEFLGKYSHVFCKNFHFVFLVKGLNSISYEAPTNICYLKKIQNEEDCLRNNAHQQHLLSVYYGVTHCIRCFP